jgi:predicted nucleic acid-binding protein
LTSLPTEGRVCIDSQIIIYLVEKHPDYLAKIRPLWERAASGRLALLASALTVMECLVIPYRNSDEDVVRDYEYAFLGSEIQTVEVSITILRRAAQMRAIMPNLRTPDAIHMATALESGCPYLVTNDRHIQPTSKLSVVNLSELS